MTYNELREKAEKIQNEAMKKMAINLINEIEQQNEEHKVILNAALDLTIAGM